MGEFFSFSSPYHFPTTLSLLLRLLVLVAYQATVHANCTNDHKNYRRKRVIVSDGCASYAHPYAGHSLYFTAQFNQQQIPTLPATPSRPG
jgi:hypothetical protein